MLRKDTYIEKSHFNVEFAVRNLPKIEDIPKQGCFQLIQPQKWRFLQMAGFWPDLESAIFKVLLYLFKEIQGLQTLSV